MPKRRTPSQPQQPPQVSPSAEYPFFDPSANVLALVAAAVERLDDLRAAEARRLTDLFDAETRRVNQVMQIHADYDWKLDLAESKRIDAIRAVDVSAVAIANERAVASAQVLANEVTKSAETLRALVATTDQARQASLNAVLQPLSDRVGLLEKSQYQIAGQDTQKDPAMVALLQEVRELAASRDVGAGKSERTQQAWGWIVGAAGAAAAIASIVTMIAK